MKFPTYILAGGKSTRFGSDKARLEIDGIPNWKRLHLTMSESGEVVMLVGERGRLADVGLRTLPDNISGKGPMVGLEAALTDAEANGLSWLFLISVDMVGIRESWTHSLIEESKSQAASAYYDERWQPLFAAYHTSILTRLRTAIEEDRLAMWRFLEEVGADRLDPPDGWEQLVSVNRPEDLQRI